MDRNPREKPTLNVSRIGLGCVGMSEFYGEPDDTESLKTIARAIDLGVTFFDTADVYGIGANERLLSKALGARRHQVTIATKFGVVRGEDGSLRGINGRPDYLRACCDASLKRLQTDYIDLFIQHRIDRNVPIAETVGAMAELIEEGKVRHIGLSEAEPDDIRSAAKEHAIAAVQNEYSMWTRDPEAEVLPLCRQLGIALIAYSPLGRGFLTGNIASRKDLEPGDWRLNNPRFSEENLEKNLALADLVKGLAKEKSCTPAQLALAWVLAQGSDIVPIPGTRRRMHLEDNIGALKVALSSADLEAINEELNDRPVHGSRY